MALRTFTNTTYFSEAANYFLKNGVYTKAPKGSLDYTEFWKEEKRRCKQGYTVGDLGITGKHYFYLNYCPIQKSEKKKDGAWNTISKKKLLFPAFWEIDYNWWWAKEISMNGMLQADVEKLQIDGLPLMDYTEGRHLCCLKTRRAGFSYKEGADGVYNYNFIPNSKSYYFASKEEYLTVDGILNKVTTYLNHLNKNTQNYWRKNRMEKDQIMYRRASYLDKKKTPKGFLSEIIGVIIDDPDKVRGKDGIKITYEEAGSFKNLKKALAISTPSVKSGASLTGQISVFGTGGEEGADIEGLEDIFQYPEEYDMLAFNNIWEEGQEDTKCGYFVPCYLANETFMDAFGNVDKEAAIAYDDTERDKKKKLKDPKALDLRVAEFPRTAAEALMRLSKTIFPVIEAQNQLKKVEKNQNIQSSILHGVVYQGEKRVEFRPSSKVIPILSYPHKNDDDLSGAVTIYYPPQRTEDGRVTGSYITVVDPYYKDQAEDRTSLWAAYVIKQKSFGDPFGDCIVASCIMRPVALTMCYKNTVYLAEFFGSKIQSEIAGGGQGFFDYLRTSKKLNLACYEPMIFNTKEVASNLKNRNYFMNISTDEKKNGLSYLAEWLMYQRGINEHGQPIYNIHMIHDIGLLREIIKYNPDKNADRLSAMCIAMFMLKEAEIHKELPPPAMNSYYDTAIYGNNKSYYDEDDTFSMDMLLN